MAQIISLDWGTSSFRAYLVGDAGQVLQQVASEQGILQVENRTFEAVLETLIDDWDVALPVIASGMITSKQGWVEVPYKACPATVKDLAAGMLPHDTLRGRQIYFVPGMSCRHQDGTPDVMRGEETQVFGASEADQPSRAVCYVTPGTHSKWIDLQGGSITGFTTYMTGEVYGLLQKQSLLGRLIPQGQVTFDADAFAQGVTVALRDAAGFLARIFSARTLPLLDQMPPEAIADYLSGLVIGTEVAHAKAQRTAAFQYQILASPQLVQRYELALRLADLDVSAGPFDVVVAGQMKLAQSAGLL